MIKPKLLLLDLDEVMVDYSHVIRCRVLAEMTGATEQYVNDAVFASGNIITEHQYVVTSQADGYLSKSIFNEGDFKWILFDGRLLTISSLDTFS